MGLVYDRRHRIAQFVQQHGDQPPGAGQPFRLDVLFGDLCSKPFQLYNGVGEVVGGVVGALRYWDEKSGPDNLVVRPAWLTN